MDPGATPPAPVCPRHPDRVSYILCQRCGRPTCPECQRPAAVGVHCVDCVRDAARNAPVQRTVVGGRVRGGQPVVTIALVVLNVASFLVQQISGGWTNALIFSPIQGYAEPYRFLTAAFLHANVTHIAFNMIALWFIGPYLETTLGRWRYVMLYVLSAVAGNVMVLLLAGDPYVLQNSWGQPVLGASGAVFGLFGAVLVVVKKLGQSARSMFVVIALNLAIGFIVPGISWQGHVGGLIAGTVMGATFAYAPRSRRLLMAIGVTVLVAVAVVVLAMVRYRSVGL